MYLNSIMEYGGSMRVKDDKGVMSQQKSIVSIVYRWQLYTFVRCNIITGFYIISLHGTEKFTFALNCFHCFLCQSNTASLFLLLFLFFNILLFSVIKTPTYWYKQIRTIPYALQRLVQIHVY